MLSSMFEGLFDSSSVSVISVQDFVTCILVSLLIGLVLAFTHMDRSRYTKSFVITLALLPAAVCVVIMMVNGNVGAGVAVAGAFGLVRFRSAPGTAKEITMVFLAMAAGLITGMGYLAYGVLFTLIMCGCSIIYHHMDSFFGNNAATYKTMNITIPEDLDYTEVFEEIFQTFTDSYELIRVKTTNMGSMFRLTYDFIMKDVKKEKEMIDQLRCRNGNLEITVSKQETGVSEL